MRASDKWGAAGAVSLLQMPIVLSGPIIRRKRHESVLLNRLLKVFLKAAYFRVIAPHDASFCPDKLRGDMISPLVRTEKAGCGKCFDSHSLLAVVLISRDGSNDDLAFPLSDRFFLNF